MYKKIILKISGEAFGKNGFDFKKIDFIQNEIKKVLAEGIKIGIVVGAGNILRGRELLKRDFPEINSHYIGMLGTVLNGMILREVLVKNRIKAELFSPVYCDGTVKKYESFFVSELIENGVVAVLAGGTGLPFVTTDTTAVLRAIEIGADVLIKATKVKGVYSKDPVKNKRAKFFKSITYDDVIKKDLGVMDLTSIALSKEKGLKILVIDFFKEGNILKAVKGMNVGTIIE